MTEITTFLAEVMSDVTDKESLLLRLKSQSAPVRMQDLLAQQTIAYSERTVRRWIAEWVALGLVRKTGEKSGARYHFIHADDEQVGAVYFSPASKKIIEQVKKPYGLRKPQTYHAEWLESYRPNIDAYLSKEINDKLLNAGKRAKDHEAAGTYARQIYNRLLIDLSYNSARLEGNTYSLLDTKKLLMEGIESPDKLTEEKTMILNHKEAIRYLVDQSHNEKIDEDKIFTLHQLLSDGLVAVNYSGQLRDYGVRIGGSSYVPLENLAMLRKYLKDICRKASAIHDPYEKSFFLLVHIAYLQAFVDVNKRTARLSANIPLIYDNLVPLAFEAIDKNDYASAMIAIYELNDIGPLRDLYVHSYLHTAEVYTVTIEAIGFDPIRVKYRQIRREIIRQVIIRRLHKMQLLKFIEAEVFKAIPLADQDHVMRNIKDDLDQLGVQSIAGLGITHSELTAWLKGRR